MNIRIEAYHYLRKLTRTGSGGLATSVWDLYPVTRGMDRRDRRLFFSLVHGVLCNRSRLDYIAGSFLKDATLRQDSDLMLALHLGVFQLVYLERIPSHAAVNETVAVVKSYSPIARFAGMVNGILRAVTGCVRNLPAPDRTAPLYTRLSVEYSHPEWLVQRWLDTFGLARTKKILAHNNTRPTLYIRRNMRDLSRQHFENESACISQPVEGYQHLFYRVTKNLFPQEIGLYTRGHCTIQSPSQGWSVAAAQPRSGERLCMIAPRPDTATALVSQIIGPEGTIIFAATGTAQAAKIVSGLYEYGLINAAPFICDTRAFPFTARFDKVLLYAPSTSTACMSHFPLLRWQLHRHDLARYATMQKRLVARAAGLLAPGGTLLYATHSLEPEENEDVVHHACAADATLRPAKAPAVIPRRYVTDEGFVRITPYLHDIDGIFSACLRKAG